MIRKDFPKEDRDYGWLAPDWRGSGSHWVPHARKVWQRDVLHGNELTIKIELTSQDVEGIVG